MNADLLNLDSASCPRPSGRQVLATSFAGYSGNLIITRSDITKSSYNEVILLVLALYIS